MPKAITTTALAAFLAAQWQTGFSADQSWGAWEDDGGRNLYEFLQGSKFHFSGMQKVWIKYQGIVPFSPQEGWARGRYISERNDFSGAWEAGPNTCTTVDSGGSKVSGNLTIYVGTLSCCIEAKRLGSSLILTPLSVKGEGPDVCVNRALHQHVSVPENTGSASAPK